MPEVQRPLERQLRVQWMLDQRQQDLDRVALERQTEPSLQADLDYHRRSLQADVHRDIQQGIDRGGPSL